MPRHMKACATPLHRMHPPLQGKISRLALDMGGGGGPFQGLDILADSSDKEPKVIDIS